MNNNKIIIRPLNQDDISMIVTCFEAHNWPKPISTFTRYFEEQQIGVRHVWLAFDDTQFAGYVTLTKESLYPPFRKKHIPEIVDLNVLPPFRNKGIGSLLIDAAEREAFQKSNIVGIGVGLYKDYGSAQKIYIARGYQPDGFGITYNYQPIEPGKMVCLDDDLVLWFTKTTKNTPSLQLPCSTRNTTHFEWGDKCDGWWLKKEHDFTVISERMPPQTSEKKHYHKRTEQFFYCLSGNLKIEIANQHYTLNAHEGLTVSANQPHKVQNVSSEATTFLVISVPNSHEDRVDLE